MHPPVRRAVLALGAALATTACATPALGAPQISQLAGPNGSVNAISEPDSNGVRYIGGDFTLFNQWDTGTGAAFTAGASIPSADFPKVSGGVVRAVVSDGSGGFFVGGEFTCVGALNADGDCADSGEYVRNRLVHIQADGSVDPGWDPNSGGAVRALARSGSLLYVGGNFSSIGSPSVSRSRIAALDAATGVPTAWNPGANNTVHALAVSGSTVYAAGDFTTIGGESRSRIAALDATLNATNATAWNPGANSTVYSLAVSGSTVYAGGIFNVIAGVSRSRIAALDTTLNTSNATAWNPAANNGVNAIAVSGSTVYAGGTFSTIGGESRSRIAALDATVNTNNATSWDPSADNAVNALAVSGSTVYVGGSFTSIGGQARQKIAALDATVNTSNATSWDPNPNSNSVNSIAVSGSTVFVGGGFTKVGGESRSRLAAIDADGYLTGWNPGASAGVKIILVDGSTLLIGGEFASVAGSTRRGLAAVGTDGTLSSWNPSLNSGGSVRDLVKVGTDLFFGGVFNAVGGVTRGNAGAVSLAGSCATTFTDACVKSWNPATTGAARGAEVNTLHAVGTAMLLGGPFATVSAVTREGAAAVGIDSTCLDSYTSACVLSWNPDFNERVNALEVQGDVAYMSGWFTTSGGSSRSRAAAVTVDSSCITSWAAGCLTSWDPVSNQAVNTLAISGTTLYAGGSYTSFGSTTRNRAASADISSACATAFSAPCLGSWDPNANAETRALRAAGSNVYIGGDFTALGSVSRNYLAVVGADGTVGPAIGMSRPTPPSAPTSVSAAVSGQVATVSFTPGATGGSAITGYTATCASSTGGTTRTGTGASSPLTVTDLTPGASYSCTVSATSAAGTSAASPASEAFTVAGGGATPSQPASSGSGSSASPESSLPSGAVLPLRLRRAPMRAPDGRFVTTGVVPVDATGVVQIARSIPGAGSLSRGPRTAARVATHCPITTRGSTRTFTCRTRLGTGAWTLTTEARAGSTVVASASRRVVVKAARRTAVTG